MEKTKIKKSTVAFLISLCVLVCLSVLNWGVVTRWGNVKITHLTLVGDDGLKYTGIMYVPKGVDNENKAPANLMLHGNSGNARNHESWAVEFARRGFVVLSIDYLGAGDGVQKASTSQTAPGEVFIKYLKECNFIDQERIVLSGHSLGCKPAYVLGAKYNVQIVIACGGVRATIPTPTEGPYYGNLLSLIGDSEHLRTEEVERGNTLKSFQQNGVDLGSDTEVVMGKLYGSFSEGNAKQAFFVDRQTHEGAFVTKQNLVYQIDFVQKAMEVPNPIDPNNQVWPIKDFIGLFGILAFAAFLICLFLFIIDQVPFFASIKQPLPRNIGLRGPGLVISIVAAIVFPFIVLWTGSFGLWDAIGLNNFKLFPLQQANRSFVTVIGLNLMGLIMLVVFWLTDARKAKANLRDLGLTSEEKPTRLDWVLIGKSFLLSIIVCAIGWAYVAAVNATLGTEFYAWFFGVRQIASAKWTSYIPYIVVWMLCFVVTSLGLNVERRLPSTGSVIKDDLIAIVFNAFCACFTVTFIVILQNQLQYKLGLGTGALKFLTADMTRLWGMPVGMFVAGAGHTALYRKTGSIWPGVFLMGIFCALSCVLYGQLRI